jgi:hypothetical protein
LRPAQAKSKITSQPISQKWCLVPLILTTQEAVGKRMEVWGGPGQKCQILPKKLEQKGLRVRLKR